ncbi:hypothetical protein SCG7086_AG_00190 [Chlamydiales bacterium SCGC AG-110-P3]|nr:hypothetical protein SCG7086_AG_00190 [Chlamydiales bacterium SCGC AG-110-P3]
MRKLAFAFFSSQLAGVPWDQLAVPDIGTNDIIQEHQDCVLEEERRHWNQLRNLDDL